MSRGRGSECEPTGSGSSLCMKRQYLGQIALARSASLTGFVHLKNTVAHDQQNVFLQSLWTRDTRVMYRVTPHV